MKKISAFIIAIFILSSTEAQVEREPKIIRGPERFKIDTSWAQQQKSDKVKWESGAWRKPVVKTDTIPVWLAVTDTSSGDGSVYYASRNGRYWPIFLIRGYAVMVWDATTETVFEFCNVMGCLVDHGSTKREVGWVFLNYLRSDKTNFPKGYWVKEW